MEQIPLLEFDLDRKAIIEPTDDVEFINAP